MKEAVIVDGVRTPIGRMGGSLSGFRPEELAAIALKAGVNPAQVDTDLLRKTLRDQGAVICD